MIIDGKKLSEKILSEVKQEVIEIKKSGKTPILSNLNWGISSKSNLCKK